MDTRVLKTLEYDKVIRQLEEKASSTLGKAKAASLTPSADIEEVRRRQQMTHEGMEVLRLKGGALLGGIRDIRASLKRASIGGMLGPQELMDIASTLYASGRLKKFIFDLTDEHDLPILQGLAERITPHRPLQQAIRSCIDDNGQVLDAASPRFAKNTPADSHAGSAGA